MKVVAIIQARMGSTRLPGKVLRDVSGKPMLWHMIDRLRKSDEIDSLVLATSELERDDVLEDFSRDVDIDCFRGSEDDVLGRYYYAAKKFNVDVIVRLTGDCPLIDQGTVDNIVKQHLELNVDYTRTLIDETNKKSFPRGLDTEVFSIDVLKRIHKLAKESYEREHVTIFIYQHPQLFRIKIIEAEENLQRPSYRLCVDVEEDLKLIRKIYDNLYKPDDIIDIKDVIKLLDENPELQQINANAKQKSLHM